MKIILGDNPFFGVDHSSGSADLRKEDERFEEAVKVVSRFKSEGGSLMMLSNHPSAPSLMDCLGKAVGGEIEVALVVPYPHKYNDVVAARGYVGLAKKVLMPSLLSLLMAIISFLCRLNYRKWLLRALIDAELRDFKQHRESLKYVCLHNILTDMFIAGSNDELMSDFIDVVRGKGLEPVIITQNPKAVALATNRNDYTLCFTLNPVGYMVNPGLSEVVRFLQDMGDERPSLWAMQILASGAATTHDALALLRDLSVIDGILYATTKPQRITAFFAEAKEYFARS